MFSVNKTHSAAAERGVERFEKVLHWMIDEPRSRVLSWTVSEVDATNTTHKK